MVVERPSSEDAETWTLGLLRRVEHPSCLEELGSRVAESWAAGLMKRVGQPDCKATIKSWTTRSSGKSCAISLLEIDIE